MKHILLFIIIPFLTLGYGSQRVQKFEVNQYKQVTTPSAPPSGSNRIYFKNDDVPYILNSSSTESFLLNYTSTFTDNALIRADGTTGVQDSNVLINDNNDITIPTTSVLNAGDTSYEDGRIQTKASNKNIELNANGSGYIFTNDNLRLPSLTASQPVQLDGSSNLISALIDLTGDVTGVLPSANGGVPQSLDTTDSPTFSSLTLNGVLNMTEQATPSNPSANDLKIYPIDDGGITKLATLDSAGTETILSEGGGGTGGINYIDNFDFEDNNTTGWNEYDDTSGRVPTDGATGSAANLTVSATSTASEVQFDTYSFKISKGAADAQAEGTSYDFSIDPAMQSRQVQINFQYSTSANYADNDLDDTTDWTDLIVYVYDVTNAKLIQPINFEIPAGEKREHYAFFQASPDSTSYRLIFHVSTTNASAWDVFIDNIIVGPVTKGNITPVVDTFDCTPQTTSITNGSFTHQESKCRIVGDQMTITSSYEASGAATGNLELTDAQLLPAGYDVDTTKIDSAAATPRGAYFAFDSSAASTANDFTGIAQVLSSGNIRFYTDSDDNVGINTPFTWASGDFFTFTITVPIKGHGGNASVSEIRSQREIVFSATASIGATSLPSAGTNINLDSGTIDTDNTNSWDSASDYWVAPESGYYYLSIGAHHVNMDYAFFVYTDLDINGSAFRSLRNRDNLSSTGGSAARGSGGQDSGVFELNKGDTVAINLNSKSINGSEGGSINFDLNIIKVQSPHANAPLEKVRVTVTESTAISITSAAPFVYGDEIVDTHGAYDSSTGVFTASRSGYANLKATITSQSVAWSAGDLLTMVIQKNGSNYKVEEVRVSAAITTAFQASINALNIPVNKGDTLEIDVVANPTVNSNTTSTDNMLEITLE